MVRKAHTCLRRLKPIFAIIFTFERGADEQIRGNGLGESGGANSSGAHSPKTSNCTAANSSHVWASPPIVGTYTSILIRRQRPCVERVDTLTPKTGKKGDAVATA